MTVVTILWILAKASQSTCGLITFIAFIYLGITVAYARYLMTREPTSAWFWPLCLWFAFWWPLTLMMWAKDRVERKLQQWRS